MRPTIKHAAVVLPVVAILGVTAAASQAPPPAHAVEHPPVLLELPSHHAHVVKPVRRAAAQAHKTVVIKVVKKKRTYVHKVVHRVVHKVTVHRPVYKPVYTAPSSHEGFSSLPRDWQLVAHCESTDNLRARSSSGKYLGAFQIERGWWESAGLNYMTATLSQQYALALKIWHEQGWGAWTCASIVGIA